MALDQPGFGVDSFGEPELGLPAQPIPPRVALTPIAAKLFDLATKKFVVNSDGQYEGTTPVLQWVHLQVHIVLGSIPSAPQTGNPAHQSPVLVGDHAERVRNRLISRLNYKVAARELQIHSLIVEVRGNATLIGLDVTDLTTGERTGPFVVEA